MLVYKDQNLSIINNLGKIFLNEKDYAKAMLCFEIAANIGSSDAMLELAQMYMKGLGTEKNIKKAKKYLKVLSNKYNSDSAQYHLGLIYNSEKKYLKSKEFFELSANQENPDALMKLGIIHRDGLGVKKNPSKTFQYFEKAAKLGAANALFYLGVFCRDGFGTEKNSNRERRYNKLAVRYGVPEACTNLGLHYHKEGNIELAKYYWGISSNSKAQYNLGIVYQEEKNYNKAKEMYEKAAKQNHSDAILAIGKLYLNGLGVEENIDIALDYIVKAARLNNYNAIRIIDETVGEFERDETRLATKNQSNSIKNFTY